MHLLIVNDGESNLDVSGPMRQNCHYGSQFKTGLIELFKIITSVGILAVLLLKYFLCPTMSGEERLVCASFNTLL